jgi:hypothetical protein
LVGVRPRERRFATSEERGETAFGHSAAPVRTPGRSDKRPTGKTSGSATRRRDTSEETDLPTASYGGFLVIFVRFVVNVLA